MSASLVPLADAAAAALSANLKLEGARQGKIKGSVTKKGREESIEIIAFSHEILAPRDAASGLPTGKRQHKPFTIIKRLDRSSPLLNTMLTNNENIPKWKLDIYLPSAKGSERLAYTIELSNASIASIQLFTTESGEIHEQVTFTYQRIEWLWTDGGITAMDDWETPVTSKSKKK